MKKLQYADPKLMERIEALDFSNTEFVDVDEIALKLRSLHQDYNRKPLKPFKMMVEKAVEVMLKNNESDDNNEETDDNNNNDEQDTINVDDKMVIGDNNNGNNSNQQDTIVEPPVKASKSINDSLINIYKETFKPTNEFIPLKDTQSPTPTKKNLNGKRGRDSSISTPSTSPLLNSSNQSTPVQNNKDKDNKDNNNKDKQPKKLRKDGMNKIGVIPGVNFDDIGGLEGVIKEIREQIEFPMSHPEIYQHLGVDPPRGILLHGPPGCGKTLLANCIAGELKVPLISISAPEIASGMSGESEAKIRQLFASAQEQSPCIIFIDEIDAIAPKRENASKEMERRIVAQLLTCMDGLTLRSHQQNNNNNGNNNKNDTNGNNGNNDDGLMLDEEKEKEKVIMDDGINRGHIIVIGATNRPESIDPALRMGGRFDKEIGLGVPDSAARGRILRVITRRMRLHSDFDYEEISGLTPGYVGADLNLLAKEAATFSIIRVFNQLSTSDKFKQHQHQLGNNNNNNNNVEEEDESITKQPQSISAIDILKFMKEPFSGEQLESLFIEMDDFRRASKKVQPSAKREGFATIPNVSWEDIGALSNIREELTKTILRPIKYPGDYKKMGIDSPAGVLMYGPPGCGKTLLAKAIANECQANFISVKGPELLNKYVGESERAVRQVFSRASASAPCVIFFDEFDALAPRRGSEGSQATERVVNQLLTEMDGLEKRSEVFIVAATNRPDIIDQAMLRPGRLDKLLYVPLPSPDERVDILRTITAKIPLDSSVDLDAIGKDPRCHAFSGADLSLLVKESAMSALDRGFESRALTLHHKHPSIVTMGDFNYALSKTRPSVSKKDELMYDRLNLNIKQSRDQKNPKPSSSSSSSSSSSTPNSVSIPLSSLPPTSSLNQNLNINPNIMIDTDGMMK